MMTPEELLKKASEESLEGVDVQGQITELKRGEAKTGSPYFDIELSDATSRIKLKIWSDTPAFSFFSEAKEKSFVELTGNFSTNKYGLNADKLSVRSLTDDEIELLLSGSPEHRAKVEENWEYVQEVFSNLENECLKKVALKSFEKYEAKWLRAAAARDYHHAYRGGLLIHTSQMLRVAEAVAPLYEEVDPSLLYSGVLFHDIGKMWENDYEENGFSSPYSRIGEMMGHISIGIQVVNQLWNECKEEFPDIFEKSNPPSPLIKEHLLHLIASHHGYKEFGAPVTPRTPEAWMLHLIDNMDAKIEMLRCAYKEKPEVAPGIFEQRRPLQGLPILPLKKWESLESPLQDD